MRQRRNLAGLLPPSRLLRECGRGAAVAALLGLTAFRAEAQPPAVLPAPGAPAAPPAAVAVPLPPPPAGPALPAPAAPCVGCIDNGLSKGVAPWDFYVRSGIVTPVGHGGIDEHVDTGWTIQFGLREPISCPHPTVNLFANFGGGFTYNGGDKAPVVTSGRLFFAVPPDDHDHRLADFAESRLDSLQRSFLQASLDADYAPAWLNTTDDHRAQLFGRAGMRGTKVRAQYNTTPTPAFLETVLAHVGHGHNGNFIVATSNAKNLDYAFGLFLSVGASVTYYDCQLGGWNLGDVTLGAEIEYGYDWFDLGDYSKGDPGLATISPLLSIAFAF